MGRNLEPRKHMLIHDMIYRRCFTTARLPILLKAVNLLLGIFALTYAYLVAKAHHLIVEVDHEV
jgi:hypothetical protein